VQAGVLLGPGEAAGAVAVAGAPWVCRRRQKLEHAAMLRAEGEPEVDLVAGRGGSPCRPSQNNRSISFACI